MEQTMLKPMKSITFVLTIAIICSLISGCESDAQTDALIGAGIGAGIGSLVGGDSEAIAIGAGVGAAGGYVVGSGSDKKKAKAANDRQLNSIRNQANTVVVWITNTNGSQKSVTLRKSGPGYYAPRGEYYPSMPTQDQLRTAYGF
jgi:hypothetical protein